MCILYSDRHPCPQNTISPKNPIKHQQDTSEYKKKAAKFNFLGKKKKEINNNNKKGMVQQMQNNKGITTRGISFTQNSCEVQHHPNNLNFHTFNLS